jgi:DNA-binding ferritin-like protein (Dps family)
MQKERKATSSRVKQFANNFQRAAKIIIDNLGEKPFHIHGPLNSAALDAIFCTILDNLEQLPKDMKQRFKNLVADNDFLEVISYSTSDEAVLKKRFELAEEYLTKR